MIHVHVHTSSPDVVVACEAMPSQHTPHRLENHLYLHFEFPMRPAASSSFQPQVSVGYSHAPAAGPLPNLSNNYITAKINLT